jgi:hypothetical protein
LSTALPSWSGLELKVVRRCLYLCSGEGLVHEMSLEDHILNDVMVVELGFPIDTPFSTTYLDKTLYLYLYYMKECIYYKS